MLPYIFNVMLAAGNKKMLQSDQSSKARRKKMDVPIHGDQSFTAQKTFSANFNSRKKHKNVEFTSDIRKEGINLDMSFDHDPESIHSKPNRKQLSKEIERLRSENLQLVEQLTSTESVSLKKMTKLKEKLNAMNNFNGQISNDNQILKDQYEQLMKGYEDLKLQLEETRDCKSCEEMKSALESSTKDYTLLRATNKELLEDINMLKNVVYR